MKGVSKFWWLLLPLGMAVFVILWFNLTTFEVKLGEEPATEIVEGRVIEVSYDQKKRGVDPICFLRRWSIL